MSQAGEADPALPFSGSGRMRGQSRGQGGTAFGVFSVAWSVLRKSDADMQN